MKASDIGKIGVWGFLDACNYKQCIELAQNVETLGYAALWVPEGFGRDPFVTIAMLAGQTSQLYLATGIANIYARDPMAMAAARYAIDELSGGRLILGLGVSHRELVSAIRSHDYGKPVSTMRAYLKAMHEAMYMAPKMEQQGLVILAALRDKMLGLSSSAADGAHPYFVTPEHTAKARQIIGPDKFLAPEQKVLLVKDASEARPIARKFMAMYLGLENYRNNLLTLGFNNNDFEQGGSDRLVDAIVAWGDEGTILKRLEAHWHNGADHVCIQALRPDGKAGYDPRAIEAFAPN